MTKIENVTRDYNVHAECSPSQLASNMLCPGRRRLIRSRPNESNVYADEGTMLHECIEHKIRTEVYKEPTDEPKAYMTLDNEQTIALEDCYDYFVSVMEEIEKESTIFSVGFEVPTSLAYAGIDEVSGHVDVRILSGKDHKTHSNITRLDIIDWKFGQGVFVPFENNAQTRAYAAGSIADLDSLETIDKVHMHICQPRLEHMGAEILSGRELSEWVQSIVPKVKATRDPEAPCVPGEKQCKWCIGPTCRARFQAANSMAEDVFANYVPGKLSDFVAVEELIPMYEKAQLLNQFVKDIARELFNECYNKPDNAPGYKVVEGRANRAWKDEETAKEYLIGLADDSSTTFSFEDLFKSKFITVAQAEKLAKGLKKEDDFKKLWEKPAGKLTLAPEDDPRAAVKNSPETAFAKFVGKE